MPSKKIWYVYAIGHTNEVIASELPSENFHRNILCQDGRERSIWTCEYSFVTRLQKGKKNAQLEFKVFYRERPYAPVKLWPFLRRQKMTLAQALNKGVVTRGAPAVA